MLSPILYSVYSETSSSPLHSQVTTHSHLLSTTEMETLGQELEFSRDQIKWFLLQEFDTEMDFSNKIK